MAALSVQRQAEDTILPAPWVAFLRGCGRRCCAHHPARSSNCVFAGSGQKLCGENVDDRPLKACGKVREVDFFSFLLRLVEPV